MPIRNAWSVTRDGLVFKFNGVAWAYQTTLEADAGVKPVRCFIRIIEVDTDIWISAATDIGVTKSRMYHFDGAVWTHHDLADTNIYKMDAVATDDIWAIGGDTGGDNAFWHWNGVAWSKDFTVTKAGVNIFYLVGCAAAASAWFGGGLQKWQGTKNFYRYNGINVTQDDFNAPDDGDKSDFGAFSIYYDGTQYYYLTVTQTSQFKLYTRASIAVGTWNYHSTIPVPSFAVAGNRSWGKCLYVVGTKIFAIMPKEPAAINGGSVWLKDGAAAWANITPVGINRVMAIDGDSDGNVWVAGSPSGMPFDDYKCLWYRAVGTGIWTQYLIGRTVAEDNYICDVDSDFFVDTTPPYVDNEVPTPGATLVPASYAPEFDLKDVDTPINPLATVIRVSGALVYELGVSLGAWNVVVTPLVDGYHYQLNHTAYLPYTTTIPVRVCGEDTAAIPNTVDYTWSFTTMQSNPILNPSYEEPGLTYGTAENWSGVEPAGSEDLPAFNEANGGCPTSAEGFEAYWDWNQNYQMLFGTTDIFRALFEGWTLWAETFEYSWKQGSSGGAPPFNHLYQLAFYAPWYALAAFDSGTEDFEDFEDAFGAAPYNQQACTHFDTPDPTPAPTGLEGTISRAFFDSGVDAIDDFEESWGWNGALHNGDFCEYMGDPDPVPLPSGAKATLDLGIFNTGMGGTTNFEDFEGLWPSVFVP